MVAGLEREWSSFDACQKHLLLFIILNEILWRVWQSVFLPPTLGSDSFAAQLDITYERSFIITLSRSWWWLSWQSFVLFHATDLFVRLKSPRGTNATEAFFVVGIYPSSLFLHTCKRFSSYS
jgi:hypothetical protein